MISKCRSCGKTITFIRMPSGKMMPCNATLRPYKAEEGGTTTIITRDGKCIKGELVPDNDPQKTGLGYIPHWGDCPGANKMRKK